VNATGKMHKDDLVNFLFELGEPLGWDSNKLDKNDEKIPQYLLDLKIPIILDEPDFYSFLDVLNSLVMLSVVKAEIQKYLDENTNHEQKEEELKS
jgi:hypothetical protein